MCRRMPLPGSLPFLPTAIYLSSPCPARQNFPLNRPHQMRRWASASSGSSGLMPALYHPPASTRARTLALFFTVGRLQMGVQLKGPPP